MRIVSLGFLSIGVFVLMQVILPLASFQIWLLKQNVNSQVLISPQRSTEGVLGVSVKSEDNFPAFVSSITRETQPNYSQFKLSVPRLKLDQSIVYVDNNDLSKGLSQLPGSALPGEKGNVFISGHSALSPLLGIKKAPFAKLMDLKKGDEIFIEAANTKFTYKVVDIKVVDPKDLSVIPPPDSLGRYISLMTCVPPGLNFKRLVVIGKMV